MKLCEKGGKLMGESEFGNISWVYYVSGAYAVVAVTLLSFALNSIGRHNKALESLKEEMQGADTTGTRKKERT